MDLHSTPSKMFPVLLGVAAGLSLSFPEAQASLSVSSDDFEDGTTDGNFTGGGIAGWTTIDTGNGMGIGTFNPDSTGLWYDLPDLDDTSGTGGQVGTMDGPVGGYIFIGGAGDGFSRDLGTIEGDQQYTATFSISGQRGSATNNEVFHGYTLEFYSGSMVLSTVSSNLAPGTPFEDVSVAWESTSLPLGVNLLDTLSVRLLSNGQGDYLDFDNFRVTEISIPEPTGALLGALAFGLGLTARRRS